MLTNDAPLLLDVTRLVWRRWSGRHLTGIDRVCLAYLEHFGPRAQAVVHHRHFRRILDRRSSQALFDLLRVRRRRFRAQLLTKTISRGGGRSCSARSRLYLNIGHTGLDSDGFRAWVRTSGVRPIYFVHDLIPITHPEFCRSGEAERHHERMRTVVATASGVIGNSQSTLGELAQFAAAERLAAPPSVAAWLGCRQMQRQTVDAERQGRPSFLTIGTIEARKNHLLLLRIWLKLIDRLADEAPQLLIIGQRGWEAEQVFELLDNDRSLGGHVVELNRCSDDDLATHLVNARALLFPSYAEGFGLPLVEALALRVPVIASDLPVFREIGRGIPTLLRPTNASAWEAAILDYARPESAARAAQLERMQAFRPFEWAGHFRRVEEWLATLD